MPEFWSVEDQEHLSSDPNDAIEEYLDGLDSFDDLPETVELVSWDRVRLDPATIRYWPLDHILEWLDDTYGDPRGEPAEATPAMRAAETAFLAVVLEGFEPKCEIVGKEVINAAEWVREHRPDWLEEP